MAVHFINQTVFIETCPLSDQNLIDIQASLVGAYLEEEQVTINSVGMAHVLDETGEILNSQLVIQIVNEQSSGLLNTTLSRKDVDILYREAYEVGCFCKERIECDLQVCLDMRNGHVPTIAAEFHVNGKANPIGKVNDDYIWQDYQEPPVEVIEEEIEEVIILDTSPTYIYQQPQTTVVIVEDPYPYAFLPFYDPYYYGW
jgi:hypothetical protein